MLTITEECINCNACIDECPNDAIYNAGEEYVIDGQTHPTMSDEFTFIVNDLCKLCEGYSDNPTCIEVCPVDAVVSSEMAAA